MEKVCVNVEDLAKYIFELNENNIIFLDLKSVKTNKELFFFYFDLFCKGLVILFGMGNNSLLLNTISDEDFRKVKKKLEMARIKLNMIHYDIETAILLDFCVKDSSLNEKAIIEKSIQNILKLDDNLELNAYEFHLYINEIFIVISFEALV